MNAAKLLERIKDMPGSGGLSALREHWQGKRLTRGRAIAAKCCDCTGYHRDGRVDCQSPACPLYPYMPYRKG